MQPCPHQTEPFLPEEKSSAAAEQLLVEVGPRMNFSTAWSSNALSIFRACGLKKLVRIERSRRYLLTLDTALSCPKQTTALKRVFAAQVHDKMTECLYTGRLTTFDTGVKPAEVYEVDIMSKGQAALEEINKDLGLGFDDQDLVYYTKLFQDLGRNPTSVECFDVAQSNSEHSRHWFFGGKMVFDGKEMPHTLMQLVKSPWKANPSNSTIAFCDNSSAMKGAVINTLIPETPGQVSAMKEKKVDYDLTLTAETHNFPCGVAPFPGAETGTGGRLRDGHATGTGSLVVAGTAAYCVGNLNIPDYDLPWERKDFEYPPNIAKPLQIIIDASNGASDYGNKFGEPLVQGFTRSFGMRMKTGKDGEEGERREWIKPIMFSGGVGQMDARHRKKDKPEVGMNIVKLGGPAYRIGMGGGAASSMLQGDNAAHLDFNAVQRGDAEMEQKTNRVIRTCVELGADNPIVSIHDQGAGGNGNVCKEIVEPEGAIIEIRDVLAGDKTLSVLELWGAEFQENDCLLLKPESMELFAAIAAREKAPWSVVGRVTGDGKIVVHDSSNDTTPFNLSLETILSGLPSKTFKFNRIKPQLTPVELPRDIKLDNALDRVLRLLSVSSKRFLTSKVDRSVTGLIAQQQCVGPLQLTMSDVAVIAQSHFGKTGCAFAIGEQPIKGLLDPSAMARMTMAESLTNLVWAKVTALEHVKCSGNWMWAAKLEGEGIHMYEAAESLAKMMIELGIAIDGGKDSLSMAARTIHEKTKKDEMVKCPGSLVMSSYVSCPDVTLTVTPDLELKGENGVLLYISLADKHRLGGSALAHVFDSVGEKDECPDVESSQLLKDAFETIQSLIDYQYITAGHDRSDGGLLVTVLEMAFAGNAGVDLDFESNSTDMFSYLFSEEVGMVIEVNEITAEMVMEMFAEKNVLCSKIGKVRGDFQVNITFNGQAVLNSDVRDLRDTWEATGFELDKRQTNPICVEQEQKGLRERSGPSFKVPFEPMPKSELQLAADQPEIKVAIVRQEGSNGDREMASAFHMAGFTAWDVHMSDLLAGKVNLDDFRGIAFVGGFSYADTLDSAKGWAGTIKFNDELSKAFQKFYEREDTFSLGVCNGCQLMSLLGWVPQNTDVPAAKQARFVHNQSGRFESRFSAVQIVESAASKVMLKDMEGSTLGVWVAHGEGRAYFPESSTLDKVLKEGLAPLRYVDDDNTVTEAYPFNPNGSPSGIASLCSPDGRHLAMMPHPERCVLKWQWPYLTREMNGMEASPWLKMFQNAYEWCVKNPSPQ